MVRQMTPSEGAEKNGVEHMECLFEGLPDGLSLSQKEQAVEFLTRNSKVFSESEFDIGRVRARYAG